MGIEMLGISGILEPEELTKLNHVGISCYYQAYKSISINMKLGENITELLFDHKGKTLLAEYNQKISIDVLLKNNEPYTRNSKYDTLVHILKTTGTDPEVKSYNKFTYSLSKFKFNPIRSLFIKPNHDGESGQLFPVAELKRQSKKRSYGITGITTQHSQDAAPPYKGIKLIDSVQSTDI